VIISHNTDPYAKAGIIAAQSIVEFSETKKPLICERACFFVEAGIIGKEV
jgi:hypothetical protein